MHDSTTWACAEMVQQCLVSMNRVNSCNDYAMMTALLLLLLLFVYRDKKLLCDVYEKEGECDETSAEAAAADDDDLQSSVDTDEVQLRDSVMLKDLKPPADDTVQPGMYSILWIGVFSSIFRFG